MIVVFPLDEGPARMQLNGVLSVKSYGIFIIQQVKHFKLFIYEVFFYNVNTDSVILLQVIFIEKIKKTFYWFIFSEHEKR